MPTTPNLYSFLTLILPIFSLATGYFFGYENAAKDALGRINYIFFEMPPQPPTEDAPVNVQMLRLMQINLPRIGFGFGGKFIAALFLISIAIIVFIGYSNEHYGIGAALFAFCMYVAGFNIAPFVWKGKAKVAFVDVYNRLSKDFINLSGLTIHSHELTVLLMHVQADVCGTRNELPIRLWRSTE